MYPIAIYPPVRQLDDPVARTRVRRPIAGEDRATARWRPFGRS